MSNGWLKLQNDFSWPHRMPEKKVNFISLTTLLCNVYRYKERVSPSPTNQCLFVSLNKVYFLTTKISLKQKLHKLYHIFITYLVSKHPT